MPSVLLRVTKSNFLTTQWYSFEEKIFVRNPITVRLLSTNQFSKFKMP